MIRVAKRKQEIRIAELTKTNPNKFFSYSNDRKSIKSKLRPLENQQMVLHIDDRRLATIFNEYFASVFTRVAQIPIFWLILILQKRANTDTDTF